MRMAATVPSTIAPSWNEPQFIANPPTAITNDTATVYWFTGREKSTRLSTQILMPITPIRPYSAVVTPPTTPAGVVLKQKPHFGAHASRLAPAPDTRDAAR